MPPAKGCRHIFFLRKRERCRAEGARRKEGPMGEEGETKGGRREREKRREIEGDEREKIAEREKGREGGRVR